MFEPQKKKNPLDELERTRARGTMCFYEYCGYFFLTKKKKNKLPNNV